MILLALLVVGSRLAGLAAPRLVAGAPGAAGIGAQGPLTLAFSEPVERASVEARLSLKPQVAGRFVWEGDKKVSFWPARALSPGQRYTLCLAAGVRGRGGKALRAAQSWQITIRPADVLFLSPSQSPELWRAAVDGQERQRLTSTGGKLDSYGVSTDGNTIAYAAKNEQQGIDLWEIGRQGGAARLLLPCGTDWCQDPAYSPDGKKIAYSRRQYSGLSGSQPGDARIWILDRTSGTTDRLLADPNIGGAQPAWSPDGRYLAFTDSLSGAVHVQDMQANKGFGLPSEEGTGVEWSPDSRRLLYLQSKSNGEVPYNAVYEVDVQTQKTRLVLGSDIDRPNDYSLPAWSPDGQWAAVGWRPALSGLGKQVWLVHLETNTSERQPITSDGLSAYGSYHWEPGGSRLVLQRLALGGSGSLPEIDVWDRSNKKMTQLAEDAFQPAWIP